AECEAWSAPRISTSWSRTMRSTSSGPSGPRWLCVSAGIREFLLGVRDDVARDALARDADRVDDRVRRRRTVRDDAHALHAEQERAAGVVGQQRARVLEQANLQ